MRQFTSATAPRQGRPPGSKNKLSAQALQILEQLMTDWTKHGAATLKILRLERPDLYARLCLETAARLSLGAETADAGELPQVLVVRWGDPSRPAPPLPPESPPVLPPSSSQLLTFQRPLV